jgi:hypothetical protein
MITNDKIKLIFASHKIYHFSYVLKF